ncbi:cytochrome P450 [Streptomyces sp. NA04227]|nr:cytochrome P450 [Streptomyces sp. NA04227]
MGRLLAPAGKQNPYPLYEEMRAHGSLVDVASGTHVFATGYAECSRALREPDLLSTDGAVQDLKLPGWREHSSWRWLTRNMLFSNDPTHERQRRFFGSAFSARAVAGRRAMIERLSDEAVRHVAQLGRDGAEIDLVPELTYRFATAVIGELLGVPPKDQAPMRAGIGDITLALDPIADMSQLEPGDAAMDTFAEYFYELVAQRRAEPREDLTSTWVKVCDDSGDISEEELVANLMLFLVAAAEAPMDLFSNTVRLALEHPEHAERLRADPAYAAGFVDETLRYEPAVHALNRVAAKDMEFFGLKITEGTAVTLMLGAGNRDPQRYPDPAAFDPQRTDIQPLTFSAGAHYCLGANVARMSAETMVPQLLREIPRLKLTEEAVWRDQLVQRGQARMLATTV